MAEKTEKSSKPAEEVKSLLCPPDPWFILKAGMGHIHCMDFSISKTIYVYIGSESGELSVWDLATQKEFSKIIVGSPILNVHFLDEKIITQEKGGLIKIYERDGQGVNFLCSKVYTNSGFCKSIVSDTFLVIPAEDGVDLYNMKNMTNLTISKSFNCTKDRKFGMLMCITTVKTSFGSYILLVYETGDSVLWDINSFSKIGKIKFKPQPIAATFEEMRGRGAVVGLCSQIQIFEVCNPKPDGMYIIYHIETPSESLTAVRTRPDGVVFVVGGSDGKIRYFSWKTLKLLVVLPEHNAEITDILFIPRNIKNHKKFTMAASSADGTISFWNIY